MRLFVSRAAAIAVFVVAGAASAADGSATAEQLFRQGRDAMQKKDYPTACRLFEESYKLEEGLGTLLNMANCHEMEGKIGTAWGDYTSLEQKATRAGPTQKDRATFAHGRVQALEPRLTRLRVQVPDSTPPGYEVQVAGSAIPPVLRTAGVIVDPGSVEVTASAPGFLPFRGEATVKGEGTYVDFTVPRLEVEPPKPAPSLMQQQFPEEPQGHKTLGYVVGGVGVAMLAGGLVVGGLAIGKAKDAKSCGEPCNATIADGSPNPALTNARAAYDSGKTLALVSDILVVAGLVGGGVGAFFILTSPSSKADAPAPKAARAGSVRVGPYGTFGSQLQVTF